MNKVSFSERRNMKVRIRKSMRLLVTIGFIISFLLTLSIVPFSQAKAFQKFSKTGANSFKSFEYSDEYNLSSYIYLQEDLRQLERDENRDYLHFLNFVVPFSNSLLNYFKSAHFTYNFNSYFNSHLHNLPPPNSSS